jgi:splicing factor 3B subunit 2
MTAETLPYQNHVVSNGDLASTNPNSTKKSKESERRRRRRKQKKNKSQAPDASAAAAADGDDSDAANGDGGDAKENADPQQVRSLVLGFSCGGNAIVTIYLFESLKNLR